MTTKKWCRLFFFSCVSSATVSQTSAQNTKYLQYDKDNISKEIYQARRKAFSAAIGKRSIAYIYSGAEKTRNDDVNYLFRQDDNFYYLTGLNEPNAVLVLAPDGVTVPDRSDSLKMKTVQELLFLQQKDPLSEQWTGRRMGATGAMDLLGFEYAKETADMSVIWTVVKPKGLKSIYVPSIQPPANLEQQKFLAPLQTYLEMLQVRHFAGEIKDPSALIFRMRAIKEPEELTLLEKASSISALAHRQAMMSCEPGMHEYEIQGLYEYIYHKMGAEYTGYPCIVGAAENSVILHYESNRRILNEGDLLLADCAAEYHNYSSDVTRTYPVSGHFSDAQRAVYQIVLNAQKACISMLKPGILWSDVQKRSEEIVTQGLLNLGVMKDSTRAEMLKFYMHGVGHSVGLDVHDVSAASADPDLKQHLQAGMLYTVEPGIYIKEGQTGVDAKYFNIGVRIEDVIEITSSGNKNLSEAAPREINEIEQLMKKKGLGNITLN